MFIGRAGFRSRVSHQKAKRKKPNHECVVFDDESGLPKNKAICFFVTASEMWCCTSATYGGVFGTGLGHIKHNCELHVARVLSLFWENACLLYATNRVTPSKHIWMVVLSRFVRQTTRKCEKKGPSPRSRMECRVG